MATIWAAARAGDCAALRTLLEPESECAVDELDDVGASPLHIAASRGHADSVALLLEGGADHALQDRESGYTALHRAFLGGNLATAAVLVRANAAVDAPSDHEGLSPLELLHACYGRSTRAPPRDDACPFASRAAPASGEVYSWGDTSSVALGRAANEAAARHTRPGRVESRGRVVAGAGAKFHLLLVDEAGELHACGLGVGGRLGLGDEASHVGPCRVPLPLPCSRVRCVAAGLDHSLMVTQCGLLFSWGGAGAALGYETKSEHQLTPRRVRLPAPSTSASPPLALHVAASATHSLACSTRGDAFAWGVGRSGQLGLRGSEPGAREVGVADAVSPRRVDSLPLHVQVASVAAGGEHSAACGACGSIYCWG